MADYQLLMYIAIIAFFLLIRIIINSRKYPNMPWYESILMTDEKKKKELDLARDCRYHKCEGCSQRWLLGGLILAIVTVVLATITMEFFSYIDAVIYGFIAWLIKKYSVRNL